MTLCIQQERKREKTRERGKKGIPKKGHVRGDQSWDAWSFAPQQQRRECFKWRTVPQVTSESGARIRTKEKATHVSFLQMTRTENGSVLHIQSFLRTSPRWLTAKKKRHVKRWWEKAVFICPFTLLQRDLIVIASFFQTWSVTFLLITQVWDNRFKLVDVYIRSQECL